MFFSVAMLALLSIICIYGAVASLMNCIFSERLLPMGPPLLKVIPQGGLPLYLVSHHIVI